MYGDGGAYNDKNSAYYEWYSFEEYPDKYDCWWGVKSLPEVKEMTPSYIDYLLNEKNGAVHQMDESRCCWLALGCS